MTIGVHVLVRKRVMAVGKRHNQHVDWVLAPMPPAACLDYWAVQVGQGHIQGSADISHPGPPGITKLQFDCSIKRHQAAGCTVRVITTRLPGKEHVPFSRQEVPSMHKAPGAGIFTPSPSRFPESTVATTLRIACGWAAEE